MTVIAKSECEPTLQWADRITEQWRQSVEAVIATGRLLIDAKAALEHGQFSLMVDDMLPFSQRTAQNLMAIARDGRLSDPSLARLLPPSWGTLYQITRLSDEQMKEAIEQKVIRPDLERWELDGFRRKAEPPAKPAANDDAWSPRLGPPDVRQWTIAQLKANAKILQALVRQAGAASQLTTVGDAISDRNLKKIWKA